MLVLKFFLQITPYRLRLLQVTSKSIHEHDWHKNEDPSYMTNIQVLTCALLHVTQQKCLNNGQMKHFKIQNEMVPIKYSQAKKVGKTTPSPNLWAIIISIHCAPMFICTRAKDFGHVQKKNFNSLKALLEDFFKRALRGSLTAFDAKSEICNF